MLAVPAALGRTARTGHGGAAVSNRASLSAGAASSRRTPDRPVALRALRQQPALVDDVAAVRLLTSAPAASGAGGLSEDEVRWARAWLVCTQAAVVTATEHEVGKSVGPAFDAERVQAPKGLAGPARQAEVLAALVEAGVLRPAPDGVHTISGSALRGRTRTAERESSPRGPGGLQPVLPGPRVYWAPAVCAVHSASVEIDWVRAVAACGREPAALLILRTLAEYVIPADAWTGVPRRDFVDRSGYQQKQVRVALRRLVAAGVIEADGENGRTARYRFAARVLAPRWNQTGASERAGNPPVDVSRNHASAPDAVIGTPSIVSRAAARATASDPDVQGVEVVLGGVTVHMAPGASLDVGPGAHARIEVGADGRLSLRVHPG